MSTISAPASAQNYRFDDDSFVGPTAPTTAQYRGIAEIHTLFKGQVQADAWTNEQITFFAPQGRVSPEIGRRWSEWYRQVDGLYQKISNMENFERVYRRNDGVNFGPGVKVVGFQDTCGAGCGNKTQAEASPGYLDNALANPANPLEWGHWILYYEMARGGASEPFYGRATWPQNTVLMPHLMAGIAFHHFGGDDALLVGIPGQQLQGLDAWSKRDDEWVEWFAEPDKQVHDGALASHGLMAAMFYTILRETDIDVIARIIDAMTLKPVTQNATQAMCDFQASVVAQTGERFVARMKGPWGLPDSCPGENVSMNDPEVTTGWGGASLDNRVGETRTASIVASDRDGDPITFSAIGLPQGISIGAGSGIISGRLEAACNCRVIVTAVDPSGRTGFVSFDWTVIESDIPIIPVIANTDEFEVEMEAPWDVIGNVLANDIGEELRTINFDGFINGSYVSLGSNGDLMMSQRGQFTDLAPGQSRTLAVPYTVVEEFGQSAETTANIVVYNSGEGMITRDDSFSVSVAAPWEVIGNVLANDVGEGLHTVTFDGFINGSYVSLGSNGDLKMSQRDQFTDLAPGTSRTLTVLYTAVDAAGKTAENTVKIVVTNTDSSSIVRSDSFSVLVEAPWAVIGNVLDNDLGEELRTTGFDGFIGTSYVALGRNGDLKLSQRGQFSDLAPGASRTLTLDYGVIDWTGRVTRTSVDIKVTNL